MPDPGSAAFVRLTLIVPDVIQGDDNALSAAALYQRGMIAALRAAGHAVDVVPLDDCPVEKLAASDSIVLLHNLAKRQATRAIWQSVSRIVTSNRLTAETLVQTYGIDGSRVAIIPPGIDDYPRSVGSEKPGCAILSVGALVEGNAYDVLVRALARLPDLQWSLTIVGSITADPAHAAAMAELVEASGIAPRVRILGVADAATLADLWHKTDLFALASACEGFAMQAAIALRRGVPVVVSNGGSAGELVPPQAGAVCPAGEDVAFSKALRRLIFDRDLRRMLADGAFEAGRTWPTWSAQAARFLEALP